ncbi:hypothetical protein ACFE04_003786 [Oxalis oulophora]
MVVVANNNNNNNQSSNGGGLKIEAVEITSKIRKSVQSIRDVVGKSYSEADIYIVLKDNNMDPNETVQKLLNQDTFHLVKSKRFKKKENMTSVQRVSVDPVRHSADPVRHSADPVRHSADPVKHLVDPVRLPQNNGQMVKNNPSSDRTSYDRNVRRTNFTRTVTHPTNRQFRVVKDNRVNGHIAREVKPDSLKFSTNTNEQPGVKIAEKSNLAVPTGRQNTPTGKSSFQASNGSTDLQHKHGRDAKSSGIARKEAVQDKGNAVSNVVSRAQGVNKQNNSSNSATLASKKDPVHVPSPDRSSAAVGAIKRGGVGVVGVPRQSSELVKSLASGSFSNSVLGRDHSSKTEQIVQPPTAGFSPPSIPVGKPVLSNQYNNKQHQQVVGNQKASLHNKEWKPKSSQKSSTTSPGVIGTSKKPASPPADYSKNVESESAKLQEKLAGIDICDNQNVIIAQSIRVPEIDRCRLTFGSFGMELDTSRNSVSGFQAVGAIEESNGESAASLSISVPESSTENVSGSKQQVAVLDDQTRNSGSNSPVSGSVSEQHLPDKNESSRPQDLQNYAGMIQDSGPSYGQTSEPGQQQDHHELAHFSQPYDQQTAYDMQYFRPTVDETLRGQGLPSPQEQQQQQQAMAQMYPQVQVSHYANVMPYHQFVSPVYVPQMPMPGYTGNPAYPHPPNGNNYVLMPGSGSHLGVNNLKYGIQQFKPVPAGTPTGSGNFNGPAGYAMNSSGVVGNGSGLEDSSRMKYKDGNLYVTNPQAETSEIWIQNPREVANMQSAQYFNIPGQSPHPYLPSHSGHASFNAAAAAAAQSAHMQYSGMYPPPQQAAIASQHHLGPGMSGNVGVAPAAPGPQVGTYQQSQLGHLNWTSNF